MSDSFRLLYTGNRVYVQRIKALLEENNIFPIIKDESESARLAGFGAPTLMQQLWVPASEVENAKAFL
ncbi:MAG: Uncharacterised protein [Bacteroidota bacterium]|nr:MAG: Uncharacterised protein [Bacteroidota bacterium]